MSTILAINNFRRKSDRFLLVLFTGFFGTCLVVSQERGGDLYRHTLKYINAKEDPIGNFGSAITTFFELKAGNLDLYDDVIRFISGFFFLDIRYFVGLSGLIFGYFYIKSLGYILDEFRGQQIGTFAKVLFLYCVVLMSINNIIFVRFWTAAWVYVFFMLKTVHSGRKKYALYSGISMLFHFGMIVPVSALLLFVALENRQFVLFLAAIGALFFARDILENFLQFSSGISSGVNTKIYAYTSQQSLEQQLNFLNNKQLNWYVKGRNYGVQIFLIFSAVLLVIRNRRFFDSIQSRLFSFILSFGVIVFIISQTNSPNIVRYVKILMIILSIFLFRGYMLNRRQLSKYASLFLTGFGLGALIFWIAVEYRGVSDFIGIDLIIGNPILALFSEIEITLRDILI